MHLKHDTLKNQNYLLPANQKDVQLSKFIFHAKTRMLKVRHNFKNNYVNKSKECPLGCGSEDTQEHLLFCSKIVESSVSTLNQPNYEDLFSEESLKQNTIAAILKRRLNIRKGLVWGSVDSSLPWWTVVSVLEYIYILCAFRINIIQNWALSDKMAMHA